MYTYDNSTGNTITAHVSDKNMSYDNTRVPDKSMSYDHTRVCLITEHHPSTITAYVHDNSAFIIARVCAIIKYTHEYEYVFISSIVE